MIDIRPRKWIKVDEAVDDYVTALKFVPDWFVSNEMFEKLDDANDDIILMLILMI